MEMENVRIQDAQVGHGWGQRVSTFQGWLWPLAGCGRVEDQVQADKSLRRRQGLHYEIYVKIVLKVF